ncbi:MAG: T9SS type A sorting domain-containing protein [Saprospiraceae bacterium]|nr:T9SS type A sorting domain-containing protein [Saprospiraceae bacterium]MBK7737216.1 T9SS type A sorting domain-containing protein [Saprospiraceae bacterium]
MKETIFLLIIYYPILINAQYTGTAAVTNGLASINIPNLYTCTNGRIPKIGSITALDSSIWTVPANVNFINTSFPFASDLYNPCTGAVYANDLTALSALDGSDIINVDSNGELITAFIFADNYFEMYINGVAVGKDNVPYTQFNSNIIRFRVNRPFTIAILLVDWEEHLGVGCENSNGFQYHMGDGGVVAVFKDTLNKIIAKTGKNWKAQTFYTAPIVDLSCPTEIGIERRSNTCSIQDSNDGSNYYGLHWNKPINWMNAFFNDSTFPSATIYTNESIGVNGKPAYTNFTNIFDDPSNDAQFIWSTNLVLDNEVVVRHIVSSTTESYDLEKIKKAIHIYPNPTKNEIQIALENTIRSDEIESISIINLYGEKLIEIHNYSKFISIDHLSLGIYIISINWGNYQINKKLFIQ